LTSEPSVYCIIETYSKRAMPLLPMQGEMRVLHALLNATWRRFHSSGDWVRCLLTVADYLQCIAAHCSALQSRVRRAVQSVGAKVQMGVLRRLLVVLPPLRHSCYHHSTRQVSPQPRPRRALVEVDDQCFLSTYPRAWSARLILCCEATTTNAKRFTGAWSACR
jgi:hypothetical protein